MFGCIWDFEDDDVLECEQCRKEIVPDDTYCEWHDHIFCSRECCGLWWADQTNEIHEMMLHSAHEKAMMYADMVNDRRRDEGW